MYLLPATMMFYLFSDVLFIFSSAQVSLMYLLPATMATMMFYLFSDVLFIF